MKALVTGGTGFTGSYVVPKLIADGVKVRCFVRAGSNRESVRSPEVEFSCGDLEDRDSLVKALKGVDVLVNIASLGFGHAPNIVAAAQASGVSRAIFISTTAVFTNLNAPSKKVRLGAEDLVKKSGLAFTILRPTMIYGSDRDRNMCRLLRYVRRWPVIPIFGDGKCLQQPVYVGDLADAIVASVGSKEAVEHCYNISGGDALSFNQVIDTAASALGRSIRKLHLPASWFVRVLTLTERMGLRLPLKSEQILRLNEDKAFSHAEAARDFGYAPRTFADGIQLEARQMNLVV